jgi:hypothetical protein
MVSDFSEHFLLVILDLWVLENALVQDGYHKSSSLWEVFVSLQPGV